MNDVVVMADDQTKGSHTPGPWTAEAVMGDDPHDICGPSRPGEGCPNLLASVAYDEDDPLPHLSLAEANANARLIAAAPDMLWKLREIAAECAECAGTGKAIRYLSGIQHEISCRECDDVRKVIAKAEGRS